MKTIRRLIYGEVITSFAYVLLAFLALFFFFDFVEELSALGKAPRSNPELVYGIRHALMYVALMMPNRMYELMPIAVLIGSVTVLTRLAHSSEYTILRTSGLGPTRALKTLLGLGLLFTILTFAMGDYAAPPADRSAQLLKARFKGNLVAGETGAWLKERQGQANYLVNVRTLTTQGHMGGVRIFEFDENGVMLSTLDAAEGQIETTGSWTLIDVKRMEFRRVKLKADDVRHSDMPTYSWPSEITAEMVSVALLKPDRMRTTDLFEYIQHLEANGQTAQRYEIEFWRKVFYPLSCLVMVVLALPFAYLHFRSGGVMGYVFLGVMIGISFFLLNNVFGYIGNLNQWQPWLAAAAPAMIYSVLSLGAFLWLVFRR
ncbi:LPS export ABC transporter permease LptG [Hydrogenophaga sp. 5NK40-0174]|uniref:LPS export ABC transporter permease LptG n=1 Tax=Hydrogenophaga sp. 5NK40-0174 TaxID=3127649 RepID=UPI003101F863